jgi:hypothetical protein
VRPALETMLRLKAVRAKPHLVYGVGFTEALEIDKWLGAIANRHDEHYTRVCDRDVWQKFKAMCASQFGADKLKDAPLSAYDAAAAIGAEAYYDSYYRGYCQYTHGALEAVSGTFNEAIDPEDTRVMLITAMSALQALVDMGADCPNIESFRGRFTGIMNQAPEELVRQ